jgi:hypothetical protein
MPTRALSVLVLGACGSYTTYQTAEPLPAGRWQASIAVAPGVYDDRPSEVKTPTLASELALRRGFGASTDLGVKLYAVGAELGVRHRFHDGARWDWAFLGSFGGSRTEEGPGTTDAALAQLRVGAAATRRTSSRWAFTVGPTITASLIDFAESSAATGLLVGGFANVEWSFGASRCWHLVPELSIHATAAGDVPVDGGLILLGVAFARDF